jgi:uncharacterized lipoprotein YddW (UPF0748 family)
MQFKTIQIVCALVLASLCSSFAVSYEVSRVAPPKPLREFRGLWIATVANIDWPSKPGLSTAAQKAELISILDRAQQLKLNAVIFQVRPACDAFYDSKLEPWSEYLTGLMGKAPEPYYDPLAFAIEEAHKRGLELHAWFNPYRALHKSHEGKVSADHISRTRPDLVRHFGQYLWLDPGERDVQEHSLKVVMDVVKRYDVDAVHFDDYFYPDPNEAPGAFPDEASWKRFGAGGKLSREDWRRENVNRFIERTYNSIKAAKPWVKFGVSPHGIWRPNNPPQIKTGSDTYAKLFADTRKWLANGWVDYFSPQLYWRIDSEYSFPILLDWWSQQNVKKRHLWPGLSAAYALSYKWPADEIPNQIRNTRKETDGYLFYNTSSLLANTALLETVRRDLQTQPALVPASAWMGDADLPKPGVSISGNPESLKLSWSMEGTNAVRWWVIHTRVAGDWQTEILSANVKSKPLGVAPEAIAVTAIDRFGNASSSSVLEAKKAATRHRILQKKY